VFKLPKAASTDVIMSWKRKVLLEGEMTPTLGAWRARMMSTRINSSGGVVVATCTFVEDA